MGGPWQSLPGSLNLAGDHLLARFSRWSADKKFPTLMSGQNWLKPKVPNFTGYLETRSPRGKVPNFNVQPHASCCVLTLPPSNRNRTRARPRFVNPSSRTITIGGTRRIEARQDNIGISLRTALCHRLSACLLTLRGPVNVPGSNRVSTGGSWKMFPRDTPVVSRYGHIRPPNPQNLRTYWTLVVGDRGLP